MVQVEYLGAPHQFLYKRFPNWKDNRKTYMIPPVFTPKTKTVQLALKGPIHQTDRGELGENLVYERLEELGKAKEIGMFVVRDFHLKDVVKWNKKCTLDYRVPSLLSTTDEFDFVIFHHALGVIVIEVKNTWNIQNNNIASAEKQLKTSHDFIQEFAKFNMPEDTSREKITSSLPHWKVIAMPSTKKLIFDRKAFKSLQDDTLLLFEEDLVSLESFEQWWKETFKSTTVDKMAPQTERAYEQALSYSLMVCHLGPVTDSDYIADLSLTLDNFRHLEQGFRSYPRVLEKEFPNFWSWCWDVLNKMDAGFNFGNEAKGPALKVSFMKEHELSSQQLEGNEGISLLDNILKQRKYILGVASVLDVMLAGGFAKKYLLFVEHTVLFFNAIRQLQPMLTQWKATDRSTKLERFPFSKLASVEDYNRLDLHLSRSKFMEGDEPTELDKEIFESLTCELRAKYSRLPIVMTTEQLAVFEGPMKQVIIGAPGTGKTELMKFKALELESEMKVCGITKKILYIVANGSPDPSRHPLLTYQIERFFKKSKSTVEVMTILLEEENPELLEETKAKLREMMESGEYGHVFIDEYWIGARPSEQEIILELVSKIPGYVWISSVFDYDQNTKKYEERTKPLIDVLENNGGVVSRMTQVRRATNTIINLERDYSAFYQGRSHPYGTKEILGHSLEGPPITWATADSVDGMYNECLKFVNSTLHSSIAQTSILKLKKLVLNPADILIVNFAVRTMESVSVTPSLDTRLKSANIPIWLFGEDPKLFMNCDEGKVTLLNSSTREDSTRLDGVEWPVVIVILPSGVLLNTAELAPDAERLRNYDTYISCFRTQVKLVIISDKWTDEKMFLKDIELKFK